jgi:endoglucanase Acf2
MNCLAVFLASAFLVCQPVFAAEPRAVENVGAGSYLTALPPGANGPKSEITPPGYKPIPTNDWCSSLFWEKFSHPHFAHPLAMEAKPEGLRIYYPGPAIHGTKDAIFGFMPNGKADLVIGHSGVEAFTEKRVGAYSDFRVHVAWEKESADGITGNRSWLGVRYGHGSPWVLASCLNGSVRITFAETPQVAGGKLNSRHIAVSVGGKHYLLSTDDRAKWTQTGPKEFTPTLPGGDSALVAILPDDAPETRALFERDAGYLMRGRSEVLWAFDTSSAEVTTTFRNEREAGIMPGMLWALYPHQWRYAEGVKYIGHSYQTVRGEMKLAQVEPEGFRTKLKFPGVLPALPRVAGGADPARIAEYIRKDIGPEDNGVHDTYGDGKLLGKWASLIPIAEQYGLNAEAELLTKRLKARLEDWLTATDASGKPKTKRVFAYEKNWGTLIGYPAGYGSDTELNDHHFHYGYFIRAAGEVARRDPAWGKDDRFGGMIKLLIRDIASPDRDDKLFPWMRNFDPYAGHSWASGHARFGDGNNNESSSEAMNAWYGIILFAQATGDTKLRDLGIWLYTTEMTAIEDYWFGVHGDTFAKGYTASVVTMVWGGKGANGTWFSGEPEAVHGINFLPITGGSLYLGRYPDYVKKNWEAMLAEIAARPAKGKRDGAPAQPGEMRQWRDILLMFHALSDPVDALKRFDAIAETLKPEGGNSMANTYHWIATLNALGQVDRSVTADHPLSATFTKDGKKTHVVYRSAADAAKPVNFSDGVTIEAGKEGWTVK